MLKIILSVLAAIFVLPVMLILGFLIFLATKGYFAPNLERARNIDMPFTIERWHPTAGLIVSNGDNIALYDDGMLTTLYEETNPDIDLKSLVCVTPAALFVRRTIDTRAAGNRQFPQIPQVYTTALAIALDASGHRTVPDNQVEPLRWYLDGADARRTATGCIADTEWVRQDDWESWPSLPPFEKKYGYLCLSAGCSVYMTRSAYIVGNHRVMVQTGYPVTDATNGVFVQNIAVADDSWRKLDMGKDVRVLRPVRFAPDGKVAGIVLRDTTNGIVATPVITSLLPE